VAPISRPAYRYEGGPGWGPVIRYVNGVGNMRDAWTGVANSATHGPRLAALFYRSNWTQEQLAKKEGKGQSWIARQVLFGRFLSFMPMGINAETTPKNLTEGKFRSYWQQTDKSPNERARFMQVLDPRPWRHALAAGLLAGTEPLNGKRCFASTRCHSLNGRQID
jgi:hypothetical protein